MRTVFFSTLLLAALTGQAATRVTLLHFSDYHSHALPFYTDEGERGGVARAIGFLRREKRAGALIFNGGGRLSVDALVARLAAMPSPRPQGDALGWGLVLLVSGPVVAMLLPLPGALMAAAGVVPLLGRRWLR